MKTLAIAELFKDFATNECEGSSELYKQLSLQVAEDKELLQLCRHTSEGQPIPNLLFGAVHYLLLQGNHHELETFYPSLTKPHDLTQNPFPFFQSFCIENRERILKLLETKRVQTNEVRRCAYLYPVFCAIHQRTKKPLSIMEIGTSAGLQLLWDQYSYSYGDKEKYGNPSSLVHLASRVRRGNLFPDGLKTPPPMKKRVGIDLHVSDLTKEEEVKWLKALIWPEHEERRKNFEAAVQQFLTNPPPLIEGDGVGLLPKVVEEIPNDSTLCIYHTHVANQMPESVKKELLLKVRQIGEKRDVFHIYNNMNDRMLHVDSYLNGSFKSVTIGETDGHGRWFDWALEI